MRPPEITDIPLIKYVAKQNKPVLISTGLASFDDIKLATETLRTNGCKKIVVLKCTSKYPTPYNMVNLKNMVNFQNDFGCYYGLSDHTLGYEVSLAAVALGAKVIEKHFVVDKSDESPDSFFSLDFEQFKKMVLKIRNIESSMGFSDYSIPEEVKNYYLQGDLYM